MTSAGPQWDLSMLAGSVQDWTFTFTNPSTNAPWPISGYTWEYVVRTSPAAGSTPTIELTTTANSQGVLSVSSSAGTVQMAMYPAATSGLTPGGYFHALWSNPGTSSAFTWFSGALLVAGNPQP